MIYAMSDIHGQYNKYIAMLNEIQFSDADILFVLGDVIDRGPQGIRILEDMMQRTNVYPILGNHEFMALTTLPWMMQELTEENADRITPDMMQGWTDWMLNGGSPTIREFRKRSREQQEDLLSYLEEFTYYDTVEAGGRRFILVHAGLQNFSLNRPLDTYTADELLFESPDFKRVYFPEHYLVTGHTPTRAIYAADAGLSLHAISKEDYQDRIFRKNNHISIDCGAALGGKLGCICLDTLEEFYI